MIFSSGFAIFLVPALFVIVERISNRGTPQKPALAPVTEPANKEEPEEAATRLKDDIAKWAKVIDDAHIPKL